MTWMGAQQTVRSGCAPINLDILFLLCSHPPMSRNPTARRSTSAPAPKAGAKGGAASVAEAEDPRAVAQLADLARLRVIGMEMADRIGGVSPELAAERT